MEPWIYIRAWKGPDEVSYDSLAFGSPGECWILAKDKTIMNCWNLHFCTSGSESLTEKEKENLVNAIINWLPRGSYLTSSGTSTRGGEAGFKRFSCRTQIFEDTGRIRVLHDRYDEHQTYFPILKKK